MVMAHRIVIDGEALGELRSEAREKGLSLQHDDGLASIRSCGRRYGQSSRSPGTIARSRILLKAPKWQDRRGISPNR